MSNPKLQMEDMPYQRQDAFTKYQQCQEALDGLSNQLKHYRDLARNSANEQDKQKALEIAQTYSNLIEQVIFDMDELLKQQSNNVTLISGLLRECSSIVFLDEEGNTLTPRLSKAGFLLRVYLTR